ncbi:MAG: hypothetical protein KA817_08235 [Flavobacteriales bacterium]|nr:hypothetical protein [Flavobacteriales bacterium]
MRPLIITLLLLALRASAQPEGWENPCGFPPNDSIDITNDGIPDLVVQGVRIGTDDEPSSSGTCALYVMNLPGTTFLNTRDNQGYWRTKVCAKGERIPAQSTRPQDDYQIPKVLYADGQVQVAYWGYGHQSPLVTVTPDLESQRFVFRTEVNCQPWQGSFQIIYPVNLGEVCIRASALVPARSPFVAF